MAHHGVKEQRATAPNRHAAGVRQPPGPRRRFPQLLVVVAYVGMLYCTSAQADDRTRVVTLPLASTYSDIVFSITTGERQGGNCKQDGDCANSSKGDAVGRFALQVTRVAAILQEEAMHLYPGLAERLPGESENRFDVYVVEDTEPSSTSSANGRIALSTALGAWQPYDDWLAFVIAREMGHVIANHHEENSSAGIVTSVIMNLLIPGSSLLKSALSAGGSRVASKSQQSVQIQEADAIALRLLSGAGYRLRDVSLSLTVAPTMQGNDQWSRDFRTSSANLVAAAHDEKQAVDKTAGAPLVIATRPSRGKL